MFQNVSQPWKEKESVNRSTETRRAVRSRKIPNWEEGCGVEMKWVSIRTLEVDGIGFQRPTSF
jgi:hypothetical protein